jgi:hypothetical protein
MAAAKLSEKELIEQAKRRKDSDSREPHGQGSRPLQEQYVGGTTEGTSWGRREHASGEEIDAEQAELRKAREGREKKPGIVESFMGFQGAMQDAGTYGSDTQKAVGTTMADGAGKRFDETSQRTADNHDEVGIAGGGGGGADFGDPITARVQVGQTKAGFEPSSRSAGQSVEHKEPHPGYLPAVAGEATHTRRAAALATGADMDHQNVLYDTHKNIEGERQKYFEQERDAEKRFEHDQQAAQMQVNATRERLKGLGPVPDTTIAGAFKRADGPRAVAGFIGMLLGGLGGAAVGRNGPSGRNHFFEQFNSEAEKVVDRYMKERGRLGEELNADQRGFDAIKQAFGDERQARDFVMASLMNVYRSRLEQAAAEYGIDKSRADYQAALAATQGKVAERLAPLAANVQEQSQQTDKWQRSQPIFANKVIYDPAKMQTEYQKLLQEGSRYGAEEYWPAELKERALRLRATVAAAQSHRENAVRNPDKKTFEAMEAYGESREKRGINGLEDVAMTAGKLADRLKAYPPGAMAQVANYLAAGGSGALGDKGPLVSAAFTKLFSNDPQTVQLIAKMANEYRLQQSGKSVTKIELGGLMAALGSGNAEGVKNFADNLKREVDMQERALRVQNRTGYDAWHSSRQLDQPEHLPHQDYRAP